MRLNGPRHRALATAPEKESWKIFARMSRYLDRLSKNADIKNVHRFRTNSRRVEALVSELAAESRNCRKLLKQLSKLRKEAGKLRDVDVQLAFLKKLTMPDRQNHRAELMERLREEQAVRSRKLAKNFTTVRVKKIRKRLDRTKMEMRFDGIDPLQLAFLRLPKTQAAALNEQALHRCRIAAKQARYLAELARESPDAKAFIDQLKRAQDEIGHWHDVLKLQKRAEKLFGGVRDSALVSVLQNITRARFRRATSALLTALAGIDELRQSEAAPKPVKAENLAAKATAAA